MRVRRVDDVDVAAGCGAREQEALQRGGTQDAAVEVGEDGGEVGGAEAGRDGGEFGGGGAVADGGEEMAAVAEQDADGVEEEGDVLWDGWGGGGVHGSISNGTLEREARNIFRRPGGGYNFRNGREHPDGFSRDCPETEHAGYGRVWPRAEQLHWSARRNSTSASARY